MRYDIDMSHPLLLSPHLFSPSDRKNMRYFCDRDNQDLKLFINSSVVQINNNVML